MEDTQTAEASEQSTESVNDESQTSSAEQSQEANQSGETQKEAKASETVSRLEYNKARETERKLKSEIARLNKVFEASKRGIELNEMLSKADPAKLNKIMSIIEGKEEEKAEDDSWLDEYDPKVASKFREISQVKSQIQRDLMAKINALESRLNQSEQKTVSQNEQVLENTFSDEILKTGMFKELNEETAASPEFEMVQTFVLSKLMQKYDDPKQASPEDVREAVKLASNAFSKFNLNETTKRVQKVVPPSGTKTGQVPKAEKVTQEDVTNLWRTFGKETGWL